MDYVFGSLDTKIVRLHEPSGSFLTINTGKTSQMNSDNTNIDQPTDFESYLEPNPEMTMIDAFQKALLATLDHVGINEPDQMQDVKMFLNDEGEGEFTTKDGRVIAKMRVFVAPNGSGYDAVARIFCGRSPECNSD